MNDWKTIRQLAICEVDDFCDVWDRSGLNFIFYWKTKFPKFKISLFAIPNRVTPEMIKLLEPHKNFIELLIHGFTHESNFECYSWDGDRTKRLMQRVTENSSYKKFFKAPGWTITPGYNGYPAAENLPVAKDPQVIYKALMNMDFVIMDRHYNKPARPENSKIICIDCNPDIVHFHTWNMETGDPNGRNGFQQVEEEHGVPWDQETEFKFVSEAWEEGLFKECQP